MSSRRTRAARSSLPLPSLGTIIPLALGWMGCREPTQASAPRGPVVNPDPPGTPPVVSNTVATLIASITDASAQSPAPADAALPAPMEPGRMVVVSPQPVTHDAGTRRVLRPTTHTRPHRLGGSAPMVSDDLGL